jgi:hypothetical protein
MVSPVVAIPYPQQNHVINKQNILDYVKKISK